MKNNNIIIPREVLFGNPDKASVSISPDGKKIAYLSARNGVLNIYVANRSEPDKAMPITHDKDRGIRNYFWAYDNEHILYLQDNEGDENWHVYRVNINSLDVKDLTPFEKSRSTIVKSSEKIPDKIIIGTNKRDPRYFDLYEADIISGELKLFYENKDQAISTEVSDDNKKYTVRFITKNNEDGSKTIYKVNGSKLEIFLEVPMEDVNSTFIVGFGETSNIVYISDSLKRNTAALIKYDQKSKRSSVIHHDLKTDIGKVLFHPRTKKVQVVYNTFLKRKEHVLDEEIREDIEYLNEFNQNAELSIISRNLEDKFWIIGYLSDTKPLTYYLYDRHHKKMKFLFSNREDLEKYNLSVMHSLIIKSRDGLDLVSYLTLPQNSRDDSKSFIPMKPVPLVLVVHGGPKGIRDNWGLNNIHQWLANRGYAVLSVNYRASGGFGKKFMNAGDGQWAKKMHDDLLDAVNWAIDNKITTKDKVCIFGGSYGGYAALVGVTFTPDVFACAVDIVGPSNLITLARSIPQYWKPFYRQFLTMLGGDPDTEEGRKFLESRSPLTYVKNIKKPILIGQGANDPRVKQAESDQIVKAMKENKIPVTYLLYPDEGHGFARPENRMSFFAITEKFLNQHLGGEAEPIGDAFKGSSIEILEGKDLKR
ncbi:MAG: S9 family peptidase [Rickettsiales bacterium]|nr:S9 family peptidase [Rickettsiales bacterium]